MERECTWNVKGKRVQRKVLRNKGVFFQFKSASVLDKLSGYPEERGRRMILEETTFTFDIFFQWRFVGFSICPLFLSMAGMKLKNLCPLSKVVRQFKDFKVK